MIELVRTWFELIELGLTWFRPWLVGLSLIQGLVQSVQPWFMIGRFVLVILRFVQARFRQLKLDLSSFHVVQVV